MTLPPVAVTATRVSTGTVAPSATLLSSWTAGVVLAAACGAPPPAALAEVVAPGVLVHAATPGSNKTAKVTAAPAARRWTAWWDCRKDPVKGVPLS
ncbi:MAG: hypothetical protein WCG47_02150 [Dermatophilaceae bacterium]